MKRTRLGSAAFARYPSVNRNTGVIWRKAIRTASIAVSKQSEGVAQASTGSVGPGGAGSSPSRGSPCSSSTTARTTAS